MLGREVILPVDLVYPGAGGNQTAGDPEGYVGQLQESIKEAHEVARSTLKNSLQSMKRDHDLHLCTRAYSVGDAVYILNKATKKGSSRKLSIQWIGPGLVVKRITPYVYKVQMKKTTTTVNHDRLKPCKEQSLPVWLTRARDNPTSAGETEAPGNRELYCICRKPDDGGFMIQCDSCLEWFHGRMEDQSPKRSWKQDTASVLRESPYEQVRKATSSEYLWPSASELVKYISSVTPGVPRTIKDIIKGQFLLAKRLNRGRFIRELQDAAAFLLDEEYLVKELEKRPSRKRAPAQSVSTRPSMCKDVRIKTNPNIDVVKVNLGEAHFPPLPKPASEPLSTASSSVRGTSTATVTSSVSPVCKSSGIPGSSSARLPVSDLPSVGKVVMKEYVSASSSARLPVSDLPSVGKVVMKELPVSNRLAGKIVKKDASSSSSSYHASLQNSERPTLGKDAKNTAVSNRHPQDSSSSDKLQPSRYTESSDRHQRDSSHSTFRSPRTNSSTHRSDHKEPLSRYTSDNSEVKRTSPPRKNSESSRSSPDVAPRRNVARTPITTMIFSAKPSPETPLQYTRDREVRLSKQATVARDRSRSSTGSRPELSVTTCVRPPRQDTSLSSQPKSHSPIRTDSSTNAPGEAALDYHIIATDVTSTQRRSGCQLSSTCTNTKHTRRHTMAKHFPPMFRSDKLCMPGHDNNRRIALEWLAEKSMGVGTSLEDFMNRLNTRLDLPMYAYIDPDADEPWLIRMSQYHGWQVPVRFTMTPLNSVALLAHWVILLNILGELSPDLREEFRNMLPEKLQGPRPSSSIPMSGDDSEGEFTVVDEVGSADETPAIIEVVPASLESAGIVVNPALPAAMDSHFHLDRATRQTRGSRCALSIAKLIQCDVGKPTPKFPVNIVGGICVFCDPSTFPKVFPTDSGFKCSIGLHPRHASMFTPQLRARIEDLVNKDPAVAALGEVGLDYTEPRETWAIQKDVLVSLMELSPPIRPLILHIRDEKDRYATAPSMDCFKLAQVNLASTQRIHLHCFTGNSFIMTMWLQHFPRCYFGFTGLACRFDDQQIQAIQQIPEDRLLLETDSPYLRPSSNKLNTPAYLGDVAVCVSKHRGVSTNWLLEKTVSNTKELYRM